MRIELRPTRAEDLAPLGIKALPHRIRALTAFEGDEPIGVGGLVFMADGTAWVSVQLLAQARRYKVALLRAAKRVLAEADASGLKTIYALPDRRFAGAVELLQHLDFRPEPGGMWVRRR